MTLYSQTDTARNLEMISYNNNFSNPALTVSLDGKFAVLTYGDRYLAIANDMKNLPIDPATISPYSKCDYVITRNEKECLDMIHEPYKNQTQIRDLVRIAIGKTHSYVDLATMIATPPFYAPSGPGTNITYQFNGPVHINNNNYGGTPSSVSVGVGPSARGLPSGGHRPRKHSHGTGPTDTGTSTKKPVHVATKRTLPNRLSKPQATVEAPERRYDTPRFGSFEMPETPPIFIPFGAQAMPNVAETTSQTTSQTTPKAPDTMESRATSATKSLLSYGESAKK